MRAFFYLALFGSVALAANIQVDCKPKCKDDCMVAASMDPADGQHCVMVLGGGPYGLGWYGSDEENSEHRSTCEESCEAACNSLCNPKEELKADDRIWFTLASAAAAWYFS